MLCGDAGGTGLNFMIMITVTVLLEHMQGERLTEFEHPGQYEERFYEFKGIRYEVIGSGWGPQPHQTLAVRKAGA